MTYDLPSAIYIYPLHPNTIANFETLNKTLEDLKAQFINEDLKALFMCPETPWGDFLTYKSPIDINIHQLNLKTPVIQINY